MNNNFFANFLRKFTRTITSFISRPHYEQIIIYSNHLDKKEFIIAVNTVLSKNKNQSFQLLSTLRNIKNNKIISLHKGIFINYESFNLNSDK
jgi:hypothetical protein